MRLWVSAASLAKKPGMPTTAKCVRELAARKQWEFRDVPGLGGRGGVRREYAVSSLPTETQADIQRDFLADICCSVQNSAPKQEPIQIPSKQVQPPEETARAREVEHAKRLVLSAITEMREHAKCSEKTAFVTLLTNALIGNLPDALLAALRTARDPRGRQTGSDFPSVASLKGWLGKAKRGESLTPKPPALPDMTVKPWYALAVALKQRPQKPSNAWIHAQIVEQWNPSWGAEPPSYDAVYRFFRDKFSKFEALKGQLQGSALRARAFYQHRTSEGLAPWDEVHADGWNTHFTAPHPVTGEFVTYEIWHFHDVATRYVTPPSIGLSESFEVIAKGLENCIRVGGVPAIWMTDSTGSVKNARMELDPVGSIAERAGITVTHPAEVGNSQANGIAENFNKYLDLAARELATYQAKDMDSLALRRVKKLTSKMVSAARDGDLEARDKFKLEAARVGKGLVFESFAHAVAWINDKVEAFNHRPHRSLPKISDPASGQRRHQTPAEALQAAREAGWAPVEMDEAAIIDLFRPHVRKTIRRGAVSPFGGQRYYHADLAHHEGEEVLVAVDPMDYRTVWVKDLQGRLICTADFVEATRYHAKTMQDAALEKRAQAQIRRKETQIGQIEERMAPAVLEAPATPVIDVAMQLFGDAEVLVEKAPAKYDNPSDLALYLYGDQLDEQEDERFRTAAG